jgi:rhomboid protease GluP
VLLGGKINPLIREGQIWRFFTPALLHANLMHIGFNMYALFALGPGLEVYYGRWRFLTLYLLGAFGGTVLSFLMSPAVSIGASGAIFGLIAAQAVFVYLNRELLGPQAKALLTNVLFIIVLNLFLGLSIRGIDNWGHMGGLLAGLLFGWFAGPVMSWQPTGWNYQLADTRASHTVWVAAMVVAAVFIGLAVLGFR